MENGQGHQFRVIRFLGNGETDGSKATIHSHASRVSHARRRRAHVIAYQASRVGDGGERSRNTDGDPETQVTGPSSLGSGRADPFASFSRRFTTQEHILFDHYIAHIVPLMKMQCRYLKSRGTVFADNMTSDWVRLALNDEQCLNALFLNAARHLAVNQHQDGRQTRYANLAVGYKIRCVRTVSDAIAKLGPSPNSRWFQDTIFIEILSLAFDEVLLGDPAMTKRHVQGAIKMVELNGGWNTLGLDGFMEIILLKYAERVGLISQVEEAPSGVNVEDHSEVQANGPSVQSSRAGLQQSEQ
ncbi:hypothetical protein V8F20_006878 [Naviculisporaceae sp. PSN 640]